MAHEFTTTRRVEFADTDVAGIMHFANFFRFMESAEHDFYRSLGFSAHTTESGTTVGLPRVKATCEYLLPLYFEDEVEIHLLVREVRTRSIAYTFDFRRLDQGKVEEVARGELTVVYAESQGVGRNYKAAPLPRNIVDRIQPAPRELFSSGSG